MARPKTLKKIDQWGTYKNKIPHNPNGGILYLSFKQSKKERKKLKQDGLAFDFKETKYAYLDEDLYKSEADKKFLMKLVEVAKKETYVEISQSGKGYHIIYKGGKLPGMPALDARSNNILYVTGDSIGKKTIKPLSDKFLKLYYSRVPKNIKFDNRKAKQGSQSIDDIQRNGTTSGEGYSGGVYALAMERFESGKGIKETINYICTMPWAEEYGLKRIKKDIKRIYKKYLENTEEEEHFNILNALTHLETVSEEKMKWRWKTWFPLKKLMIFAAEGGSGKSSVLYDIAARETNGLNFPFSKQKGSKGIVLIITAEDDVSDTIKPRFIKAGGDPEKLIILDSEKIHLDLTTNGVEQMQIILNEYKDVSMIILDPIDSYCGTVNTHMASVVKKIMGPVNSFSRKNKVMVCGVLHFNKGDGTRTNLKNMISGSASWVNSARLAIVAFEDPETEDKYMGIVKSNNGTKKRYIKYRIEIDKNNIVGINYIKMIKNNIQFKASEIFNTDASVDMQVKILDCMKENMLANNNRLITVLAREHIIKYVKGSKEAVVKRCLNKKYGTKNINGKWYYIKSD